MCIKEDFLMRILQKFTKAFFNIMLMSILTIFFVLFFTGNLNSETEKPTPEIKIKEVLNDEVKISMSLNGNHNIPASNIENSIKSQNNFKNLRVSIGQYDLKTQKTNYNITIKLNENTNQKQIILHIPDEKLYNGGSYRLNLQNTDK